MMELYASSDRNKKPAAYGVISNMKEAALPGLVQMLKEKEPGAAHSVLHAVSSSNSETAKAAIPMLIKLLDEADPKPRERALLVLGDIGLLRRDKATVEQVVKVVRAAQKDANEDVQKAAASALKALERTAASRGQKLPD